MFLHKHIYQIYQQIMRVLLLESSEPRVSLANGTEYIVRVEGLLGRPDVKEEVSEDEVYRLLLVSKWELLRLKQSVFQN